MTHRFIFIAGIMMLCLSGSARAVVIFDDLGGGGSPPTAYCIDGALFAPACANPLTATILEPAALFLSTGDYEVTQIDVALLNFGGDNNAVVSLFTDVSAAPGALLGSFPVSAGGSPVNTLSGISGITLSGGVSYFLQVSPADISTQIAWWANTIGVTGQVYDPPFGGPNLILPAFDILGTAVSATPEPASWALIGLGLAGLGIAARKSTVRVV